MAKAKWAQVTRAYAKATSEDFHESLKSVAESFADHERLDSVSNKHVDESFLALARLGLHCKRWWQRSDTWTGFGAFLVGLSFSMPDLCQSLCSTFDLPEKTASVAATSSMITVFSLGAGLFFWAKHHGSLPKKRGAV